MKNIKRVLFLGLISIMSLASFVSCDSDDAKKALQEANPTYSQMEELKKVIG